jgi:hypothetical protein
MANSEGKQEANIKRVMQAGKSKQAGFKRLGKSFEGQAEGKCETRRRQAARQAEDKWKASGEQAEGERETCRRQAEGQAEGKQARNSALQDFKVKCYAMLKSVFKMLSECSPQPQNSKSSLCTLHCP